MRMPSEALAGVSRSLRTYHGDPAQRERMDRLYRQFIARGSLAFDIGAHAGDRVSSFRRLGARVIAIEPQPMMHRLLRLIHGRDTQVTILKTAVAAQTGEITLLVNSNNPTVSTASAQFVASAGGAAGWQGQVWDRRIAVPALTLDALIEDYGEPGFAKIDVEGFEDEVLRGLSRPLAALSFEFTTIARPVARACMNRLSALAPYRYNFALGETQRLSFAEWISPSDMQTYLDGLPHAANSGDVYARLA